MNQDTQLDPHLDAQSQPRRRGLGRLDLLAAIVLLVYAALATSAQLGASVAGQGLDPIWAAAQQRGALRVAVDYGFFPFTDIVAGQPRGYDIDLARAVAAKLGLGVEFVPSSLDSIYDDLANRKADLGASALPYAPEQGWRANFSTFYFNAGQVLIVPSESQIAGPDMLAGQRLGVPLGSDADTYARNLMTNEPTILLRSQYDTPAEVLADLRRGALDAAIVDNAAWLTELGRARATDGRAGADAGALRPGDAGPGFSAARRGQPRARRAATRRILRPVGAEVVRAGAVTRSEQ